MGKRPPFDTTGLRRRLLLTTALILLCQAQSTPAASLWGQLVWDRDVWALPNDLDYDGIPDGYEETNNLNPNDPADALLDSDGDLEINLVEYLNGTDPWDQNSNSRNRQRNAIIPVINLILD
ncbi:MAG: hypothetical protein KDI27_13835 [Gammaproteobacteria bacterium]|nr:hypothetical protein [Gammaproteobacteria bacterium]MCP5417099.1 hypothetical protein [Chromatiaceae bacterium]